MTCGRWPAVVLVAVIVLTGCSGGETSAPSSTGQSPTRDAKPAAVLDGVYRLDVDLQQQLRNGVPDPGKPFAQRYAFRSACQGGECVAVGRRLRNDAPNRYTKSLVAKDGQKAPDVQIDVSTTCVRNALHCLTYAAYAVPGSRDRSVRAYQFRGKTWTGNATLLTTCTGGAGVMETTYSESGLPDPVGNPADPLPRLAGTQRESYPAPCVGVVVSDLVLARIGD